MQNPTILPSRATLLALEVEVEEPVSGRRLLKKTCSKRDIFGAAPRLAEGGGGIIARGGRSRKGVSIVRFYSNPRNEPLPDRARLQYHRARRLGCIIYLHTSIQIFSMQSTFCEPRTIHAFPSPNPSIPDRARVQYHRVQRPGWLPGVHYRNVTH